MFDNSAELCCLFSSWFQFTLLCRWPPYTPCSLTIRIVYLSAGGKSEEIFNLRLRMESVLFATYGARGGFSSRFSSVLYIFLQKRSPSLRRWDHPLSARLTLLKVRPCPVFRSAKLNSRKAIFNSFFSQRLLRSSNIWFFAIFFFFFSYEKRELATSNSCQRLKKPKRSSDEDSEKGGGERGEPNLNRRILVAFWDPQTEFQW